jgi:hypothetical protein
MKTYNFPIECEESLYDEAIKEYVSIVSKYPEVISIVQYGSVGVAGISDIDLIVYLDDKTNCTNNYSLYQISLKYHSLLMHDVFIVPFSLMSKSYLITSIFNTKSIYGCEFYVESKTEKEDILESIILLNDIAVVSLLHEYNLWYRTKNKDIKLIIARLNSIKYPYLLLEKINKYYNIYCDNDEYYQDFIDRFSKFRTNWFSKSKEDNLEILYEFIFEAKEKFAPMLLKDIYKLHDNIKLFEKEKNEISFKQGKHIITGSDSRIFMNLIGYSNTEGSVSSFVKQNLSTEIKYLNIDEEYDSILKERIRIINMCYDFRFSNKIYYGDFWTFGKMITRPLYKRIISKIKKIYISYNG